MSQLQCQKIRHDNVNVHRAAAKVIVFKSRAARGSVCNVLLSRRLSRAICVEVHTRVAARALGVDFRVVDLNRYL